MRLTKSLAKCVSCVVSFLVMTLLIGVSVSCKDHSITKSKPQVFSIDTFKVATSIVQLDSSMTSGTGTVLLGKYRDEELGTVSSSSYFQLSFANAFSPGTDFIYDSVALILPYNHVYTGDTTQPVKLSVYQLTQDMIARNLNGNKFSVYSTSGGYSGFYNTSVIAREAQPIVLTTVKFSPKSDSLHISLPKSFGATWFQLAQNQVNSGGSTEPIFSNVSSFINYFKGICLEVDPSTNACVVGFKSSKVKIRLYYRQYSGDLYVNAHTDFTIGANYQFNHIEYDRTGTALASLQLLHPMSTSNTNHTCYVQTGTGLVTSLNFPTLQDFFYLNQGITLDSASLEIHPVTNSISPYAPFYAPPSVLQLFATDDSNLPLYSGGTSASIQYDYVYPMNTVYRHQIFSFVNRYKNAPTNYLASLIVGPSTSQGASVQRLYFGDASYPVNNIKLIIYYTYASN